MKRILFTLILLTSLHADLGREIAQKVDSLVGKKINIKSSELIQNIYRSFGYTIPKKAKNQLNKKNCKVILYLDKIKLGDALYFATDYGDIHNSAIVTGFNRYGRPIITYVNNKNQVIKEKMSDKYIYEFIGAQRFYSCNNKTVIEKNKMDIKVVGKLKPIILK